MSDQIIFGKLDNVDMQPGWPGSTGELPPEEIDPELNNSLETLKHDLIDSKMQEHKVLQESVANGGPGSPNEAIINMMDYCNVGIRYLAGVVKLPRKKLLAMIEGRLTMDPAIQMQIIAVFEKKAPHLFNKATKPVKQRM